jgi:DNA-binding response OmpR family regulator
MRKSQILRAFLGARDAPQGRRIIADSLTLSVHFQVFMIGSEIMHILVVEDEKKLAELLKRGLEEEDHSVSMALDGRDALELAQSLEFDVIVLDLMLPVIDGFEVARRLRRSGNKTPILVLTARDTARDVLEGLDIGADDYMTKPFSFEEFLERLRAVSRRKDSTGLANL